MIAIGGIFIMFLLAVCNSPGEVVYTAIRCQRGYAGTGETEVIRPEIMTGFGMVFRCDVTAILLCFIGQVIFQFGLSFSAIRNVLGRAIGVQYIDIEIG